MHENEFEAPACQVQVIARVLRDAPPEPGFGYTGLAFKRYNQHVRVERGKDPRLDMSKSRPITGVILLLLALVLGGGLLSFAGPCAAHGDGSVASCYWAFRAILSMDAVLAILALVRVFEQDEGERRGLSLGAALMGILIAATPGFIIGLCSEVTMPCHAVMRPFAMLLGIAVALVGGIDLTRRLLALRK